MQISVEALVFSLLLWTLGTFAIGGVYWIAVNSPSSLDRSNLSRFGSASSDHDIRSSNASSWPKIVWLMSFPNSGTSYTLRLVQQVSNETTATNYGQELLIDNQDGKSPLVREEWSHGPLRSIPSMASPNKYILTKTHCGGRCTNCGPDRYLENYRSFQQACARGDRKPTSSSLLQHNQSDFTVQYDPMMVSKAVHLIRNPFDNIVSRFHLARLSETAKYPNNSTGFQCWCRDMDKQYRSMEQHIRWMDDRARETFRNVPCHVEFFKYVQWHNLATITVTETMKLDQLILYYEDYDGQHQQQQHQELNTNSKILTATTSRKSKRLPRPSPPKQVRALMDFLHVQQPDWKAVPLFEPRTYLDTHYTPQQRQSIKLLLQELSTVTTWKLLQRYFV